MRNILAIALLSILLCSSCKSRKKQDVHAQLKEEVYSLVTSYMDSHPQYNTYILTEAMEQTMSGIKLQVIFWVLAIQDFLPPKKAHHI
ncbi:hypothetical protein [Hoylesella shahii]|uniref:hypothetical protein n=1 Tax=Hoylesella shahii TaxID=228603 RepID=UPI001E56E0B9|nr:hypothetical protein [Hoylesella shahii]